MKRRPVTQEIEGLRRVPGDEGRGGEIDAVWHRDSGRSGQLHEFGVTAEVLDAHRIPRTDGPRPPRYRRDTIAGLAVRHPLADGDDDSGGIDAEDVRKLYLRAVLPRTDNQIEGPISR